MNKYIYRKFTDNSYTIGKITGFYRDGYRYVVLESSSNTTIIGESYNVAIYETDTFIITDTLEEINKIRTFQ